MARRKKSTGEFSLIPSAGEGFTELSRTKQGRLFEKHILTKGTLIHPVTKQPINIDDEFVQKLQKNFRDNVCDIVQVPLAGDQNQHTENPERNLGEVVDVREREGKVYAVIDARKCADDFGKTLLGASAMLHTNYVDTRSGKSVGPTLLHVAVTNRPYVVGLENYKEILAASNVAEGSVVVYETSENTEEEVTDNSNDAAQLSASLNADEAIQETTMTLEETLSTLKTEHGIDVPALQAERDALKAQVDEKTSLSNDLATKLGDLLEATDALELSATESGQIDAEVIVGAIAELANNHKESISKIEKLEHAAAVAEVSALVSQGRVLPTQVDSLVELKLSNSTLFDSLVPAEPIIKMNTELGKNEEKDELNIDDEVTRYAKLSAETF